MSGFDGSKAMSRTPRGEHTPAFANSVASPVQTAVVGAPLWMKLHVEPPFVDL